MELSVIIPVYNAEDTIENTLNSVTSQLSDQMEVILVDDCSRDASAEIIEKAAEGDPRVTLLRNEVNSGVSHSRNRGIDAAKGRYIRFVDADDLLPGGSIEAMMRVAEESDADLVIGSMEKIVSGKRITIRAAEALGSKKSIDKYDPSLAHNFSVCNKMFRREIMDANGIRFRPYRIAEDELFLFEYLQHAQRISGCDSIVYSYLRPDSSEKPTSTVNVDGEMLQNIATVSEKVLEMHKDASPDFIENFNVKILSATIISKCYRYIWKLDDKSAEMLLNLMNGYKDRLLPETWETVKANNRDLHLEKGFFTKDEAAHNALFTVVVSPVVDAAEAEKLITSLYNQRSPLFKLVITSEHAKRLPESIKNMINLKISDDPTTSLRGAAATCETPYICYIEDPLLFTQNTLTSAFYQFEKDGVGEDGESGMGAPDYICCLVQRVKDGRFVTPRAYRDAFAKESLGRTSECTEEDRLDVLISNKIFRTEPLSSMADRFPAKGCPSAEMLASELTHVRQRRSKFVIGCTIKEFNQRIETKLDRNKNIENEKEKGKRICFSAIFKRK